MRPFLSASYQLIPPENRKKLPVFLGFSLLNTLLDLISIAYLAPLMLVFFDKKQLEQITYFRWGFELTPAHIYVLLTSLLAFYLFKNLLQTRIIRRQSSFIYGIAQGISEKLMTGFLSQDYFQHTKSDKNAFFRDVFQLPMSFATNVLFPMYLIFSELLILGAVLLVSLAYAPMVTLLSFALLGSLAYSLLRFQKKKTTAFNQNIVGLYQENVKQIQNIVQGFLEIKTTKSNDTFQQRFSKINRQSNEQLAGLLAFKQANLKYYELLFILGFSVAVLFLLSRENPSDLIFLSLMAGAAVRIVPSFNKILGAVLDIKANRNAVEVLSQYAQNQSSPELPIEFDKQLQFNRVNFRFGNKSILNDVNLTLQAGDFIAISGDSGQGKSTLLQLMAGLLSPSDGSILIDGIKIDHVHSGVYHFVGYAPQQPFLFQGTLLENLTMLQASPDEQWLWEILSALDLSQWVSQLPKGLSTPLLIESRALSGGQKQRLALARVLYFKPKILLLDETTNQLDAALEEKVWHYLKKLTLETQLIIVAVSHSQKVNAFAKRHYVLNQGKLLAND